jgi:hypothetical protein
MLLSSEKFLNYLQIKYKHDFDAVIPDRDLEDLFTQLSQYVNTEVYVKLLSFIDMIEFENFQRYLFVSVRKHYDETYDSTDIENIKCDVLLQVLCLACIQYYFL